MICFKLGKEIEEEKRGFYCPLYWLAVAISLVLFFPHSIEPTIGGAMKISGEAAIDLGRKIVSLAACFCEAHNKTARWNTIKSLELESLLVFFL